ncbi:hypothetical protein [Loktanella salsilacus]|uniref:hypothetical protein n=1 Tax=Loktanella salsilacus TaxID=195913 RepID=UPI0037356A08
MRGSLVAVTGLGLLLGCASPVLQTPQPLDRAAQAAAFVAATQSYLVQTLDPALDYCIAHQSGGIADRAGLVAAGFIATNSATMTKPIAGNIGNPPSEGSAFVVQTSGCTIRTNGFSIGAHDLDEAVDARFVAAGYSAVSTEEKGRMGIPDPYRGFRRGERVLGVTNSTSGASGVPFVSINMQKL